MSFGRASLRRFNDHPDDGIPPPGAYNPKFDSLYNSTGNLAMGKCARFPKGTNVASSSKNDFVVPKSPFHQNCACRRSQSISSLIQTSRSRSSSASRVRRLPLNYPNSEPDAERTFSRAGSVNSESDSMNKTEQLDIDIQLKLEDEKAQLETELLHIKTTLQLMEASNEARVEEINYLKIKVDENNTAYQNLETLKSHLETDLHRIKISHDSLQAMNDKNVEEMELLQSKLGSQEASNRALLEQKSELEAALETARLTECDLRCVQKNISQELENVKSSLETRDTQCKSLLEEKSHLEVKLKAATQIEQDFLSFREDSITEIQKLKLLVDQREAACKNLESINCKLETDLLETKSNLESILISNKHNYEETESLKAMLNNERTTNETLIQELDRETMMLKQAQEDDCIFRRDITLQCEGFQETLSQIKRAKEEKEEMMKTEFEKLVSLLQVEEKRRLGLEDLKENLEAQIHRLSFGMVELEHLREEKETLVKKIAYLESLIGPFKQKLINYEELVRMEQQGKAAAGRDLDKILGDYAVLVGHNNPRQKILHLVKVKDELSKAKKEAEKYRTAYFQERQKNLNLERELHPRVRPVALGALPVASATTTTPVRNFVPPNVLNFCNCPENH